MGFFNRKNQESRESVLDEAALDTTLRAALGSSQVTVASVLNIPAVSSSIGFIAGTIASLPIRLYKNSGKKSVESTEDYRLRLLNAETGDLLDAFQWKCTIIRDYLLAGNGYTYVDWSGSQISGLYYIDPIQVAAEKNCDPIFKTARFCIGGNYYQDWKIMRVLRNTRDGATGYGIVQDSPTQLETMLNALKYENRMVRTGAKKGFIKATKRITQDLIDALKKSWVAMYGNDSQENVVVLNEGLEFQDAGQTAVESQLNESKTNNNNEIFKIFGIVPAVLSGGASDTDYKNTIRAALLPVIRALESSINRFLLLEEEKNSLRFEIDMDGLDGTDLLSRYQAYEIAVRNGWMQLDEVRYSEGMNPLGVKFIRMGLDTVLFDPEKNQIYTPNTNEWVNLGKGGDQNASGNQSGQEPDDGTGIRERNRTGFQGTP